MLSSLAVEKFLLEVQRKGSDNGPTNTLNAGDIVKDNEQVGLNHSTFFHTIWKCLNWGVEHANSFILVLFMYYYSIYCYFELAFLFIFLIHSNFISIQFIHSYLAQK